MQPWQPKNSPMECILFLASVALKILHPYSKFLIIIPLKLSQKKHCFNVNL
jgi:hypothetical protein